MMKRGPGRPRKITIDSSPFLNLSGEEVPYSDDLPEFFKIYTPALSSTMMRIPPNFVDKFGGNFPTTCTLKTQSGISQQVSMKKVNNDWFFQEGWPQFVRENSLQDRDFLTFCYVGKSSFLVKLFSPNGCHKVATHTIRIDEASDSESEESEIVETKRQRWHARWGNPISFKDGKPCFTIGMKKSYIRRGVMRVPLEFWNDYMKKDKNEDSRLMATLWVGDEKWGVDLALYRSRVLFQKGCCKFFKDNSIKIGNSCTFQLIDPTLSLSKLRSIHSWELIFLPF